MRDELAAVAHLKAIFGEAERGEVGIGDDAATLKLPKNRQIVWTIDEQVQNTHFKIDWLSWRDVGWRSFIAAASDIAAMGGRATHALSALAVPRDFRDEDFEDLTRGQCDAANEIGTKVVGGNLSRANEAHVTTTVIGVCDRPILRSGAREGDGVYVAGALGLASLGMRALEKKMTHGGLEDAVLAWRRPAPRFEAAYKMGNGASGAIDISDGLARDLHHVATASQVRISLDEAALREHADACGVAKAAFFLGENAIDAVLFGGEDYALVATSHRPIEGFFRIGKVMRGEGVTLDERAIEPRGFDHF